MELTMQSIAGMIRETLRDPAQAARDLTATRYDRGTLWSALALVTVLSVLLLAGMQYLFAAPPTPGAPGVLPLTYALILGSTLVVMVFAVYYVGRSLGGQGTFPDTLLLIVWFQVISIFVQLVQVTAILIVPFLAAFVSIIGIVWLFYCLLTFINVLHGFDSYLKALGTFVMSILGIGFGLALIVTMVGAATPSGAF